MKRSNLRVAVYGLLTLATMCLIFALSAQNGEESGSLSRWLMETAFGRLLLQILPPLTDSGAALDIRKYAHLAEYTALGLFSSLFVLELYCERIPKRSTCISVPFSFVYACSDEYHQTFVPGRAGAMIDVAVDLVGVSFGLALVILIYMTCMRRKELK